jgi:hypothetical protein
MRPERRRVVGDTWHLDELLSAAEDELSFDSIAARAKHFGLLCGSIKPERSEQQMFLFPLFRFRFGTFSLH